MKTLNTFLFIVMLLLTYANNSEANKWVLEGVNDAEFDSIVEEDFVDNPKVKPPEWVIGRGHPDFPISDYVVGVGFSEKNTVSASESARAELIKSIRVKVNSKIKDYHSTDKSFVEASTISETDFLLEGSQVKDGWYDSKKGIYYSFVVIQRKYVLATIQEYIDNIVSNSSLSIRQADTYFNNGEIIKALVYYYDGFLQSNRLFPYIQTYKSVSMLKHEPVVEQDYTLLFKEKIQNIVGNIEVVDDKQILNGTDIKYLVKVTFKDNPISGFPCEFNGTSAFVEKVLSNQDGICESNFRIRETTKKHTYIMNVMVDMPTFKQNFNHTLKKDFFGRLEVIDVMFRTPYTPKHIVVVEKVKPSYNRGHTHKIQPQPRVENRYNRNFPLSQNDRIRELESKIEQQQDTITYQKESLGHQRIESGNPNYPRHYKRFNPNYRHNNDSGWFDWNIWGNDEGVNGGSARGQW
jgi:hypothetical protein